MYRIVFVLGVAVAVSSSCSHQSDLNGGLPGHDKITCKAGFDCDLKWKMAAKWATESSGVKVQTTTDTVIKTAQSAQDSRILAFTITKNQTPQPDVYEIDFVGGCPSILSCMPPVSEARAAFAKSILTPGDPQR